MTENIYVKLNILHNSLRTDYNYRNRPRDFFQNKSHVGQQTRWRIHTVCLGGESMASAMREPIWGLRGALHLPVGVQGHSPWSGGEAPRS